MNKKFSVEFLPEALDFIKEQDGKTAKKIFYVIDRASYTNDPKLFKKLTKEIWEFRVRFKRNQYRLLAFWDKSENKKVLVISTHGFIKKTGKVDKKEILKAEKLRANYFGE